MTAQDFFSVGKRYLIHFNVPEKPSLTFEGTVHTIVDDDVLLGLVKEGDTLQTITPDDQFNFDDYVLRGFSLVVRENNKEVIISTKEPVPQLLPFYTFTGILRPIQITNIEEITTGGRKKSKRRTSRRRKSLKFSN